MVNEAGELVDDNGDVLEDQDKRLPVVYSDDIERGGKASPLCNSVPRLLHLLGSRIYRHWSYDVTCSDSGTCACVSTFAYLLCI